MRKQQKLKLFLLAFVLVTSLVLILLNLLFDLEIFLTAAIFVLTVLIFAYSLYVQESWQHKENARIAATLDKNVAAALEVAEVGILIYDDNYEIVWQSALFLQRALDHRKERLLFWLPELEPLIRNAVDMIVISPDEHKYEVSKKAQANVLFFKDITLRYDLESRYKREHLVLGMINFDNFDEMLELDRDITVMMTDIKIAVYDYLKKHGIIYKTLRNNRLYLVLDENIYQSLADDRFSIINSVRKEAKRLDLPITLSLAFARGSDDYAELDEMLSNLIDLAQTRGGDQVAIRRKGEEVIYFGGSSEAREKSSKVHVRVMANTLRDLIVRSSNVLIVGHKEMDADCVGAALCLSAIVGSYDKECFIVDKPGGVEPMIASVLAKYAEELNERHRFVTLNEALNRLDAKSLVFMVDHNSLEQSNSEPLLKKAERIIIIDHHRRKADLDVKPLLVYLEAGASSTVELTVEFLPYLMRRVNLLPIEANIMYLGMLIDTNHFKVKTGARTFDCARLLRQKGADPALVEELNEEPYEMILKRAKLIDHSVLYAENILIAADAEEIYPRSILSQACDTLLQTKDLKAAFVIAKIDSTTVAVSARSKGDFNVQAVLEKLNGGGHMHAAGLQVKDRSVEDIRLAILAAGDEYLKNVNQ